MHCPNHRTPLVGPFDGLQECPLCDFAIDFGSAPATTDTDDEGWQSLGLWNDGIDCPPDGRGDEQ